MTEQGPAKLEALLFVAVGPLSLGKLKKLLGCTGKELEVSIAELKEKYAAEGSGLELMHSGGEIVLGTKAAYADAANQLLKEQTQGELTRPQLETLTIIAYRGPVSKIELEMIRGVNCTLILRNLLMRGLITEKMDKKMHVPMYQASIDFIRHLGIQSMDQLPDYEQLNERVGLESAED